MQHHIYVPTTGPDDWRPLLGNPEKHWRVGYSAHSMAHAWEGEKGWPKGIYKVINKLKIEPLFAFPEFKVKLDTDKAPSQNDLFLMARDENELWSVAIEGKVQEDFGPLVSEWLDVKPDEGRKKRLNFLRETLRIQQIPENQLSGLRYQLFHRTASAVLMAKRLHAKKALMLVQSFEQDDLKDHFDDFEAFVKTVFPGLGSLQRNKLSGVVTIDDTIELRLAWVREEMPVVKIQTQTNDEIPTDIEERFGKAVNKFLKDYQADSYTQSYPHFLEFIHGKIITKELLIPAIHMIYGWMPRVFRFGDWSLLEKVLEHLNKARTATLLDADELSVLSTFLNNSMVGTSKLLHFINPDVYPIWDSKICFIFYQKKPYDHRMKNLGNYLNYQDWVLKKVAKEEFQVIYQKVNDKLKSSPGEGNKFRISKVRAAELILFSASKSK